MDRQASPLSWEDAANQIALLPEFLSPIAAVAGDIAKVEAWLDEESGALLAGYRPDIGTHAYDIELFPPMKRALLGTYQQVNDFLMPGPIVELLTHLNGCNILDLSIYGAPTSMAQNPPLLDRSSRAPLDISSGRHWRFGYTQTHDNEVLFASRNVGENGQIGYFITPMGLVVGRGNESAEVEKQSGPWKNVTEWLASELR